MASSAPPDLLSPLLSKIIGGLLTPVRTRVLKMLDGQPLILVSGAVTFIAAGINATPLPTVIARPLQILVAVAGLLGIHRLVTPVAKPRAGGAVLVPARPPSPPISPVSPPAAAHDPLKDAIDKFKKGGK